MIKLIATDLDGTLLRKDKSVSARNRAALAAARDRGIVVTLVSARPPRTVSVFARDTGVTGFAVCCNGSLVYDLDQGEIVHDAPFAAETARSLVAALRESLPGVTFALEQGLTYQSESVFAELHPERDVEQPTIVDALDLLSSETIGAVTKLVVRHPDYTVVELLPLVRAHTGIRAEVTHSGAPFVEIGAAGMHKAVGLARLCDSLGIDAAEVVAFGDMPNDIPMLSWAGRGVAVANADPEVLAVADHVTASNMDEGVAIEIERLLSTS